MTNRESNKSLVSFFSRALLTSLSLLLSVKAFICSPMFSLPLFSSLKTPFVLSLSLSYRHMCAHTLTHTHSHTLTHTHTHTHTHTLCAHFQTHTQTHIDTHTHTHKHTQTHTQPHQPHTHTQQTHTKSNT